MGCVSCALPLLHGFRSLAFGTWPTLLERWRRSCGTYPIKCRKEFMRQSTINLIKGEDPSAVTSIMAVKIPFLDSQFPVSLGILELNLSLTGVSLHGPSCHDFPTLGSVGIRVRSDLNQFCLGRLQDRRVTSIDLGIWSNWVSVIGG